MPNAPLQERMTPMASTMPGMEYGRMEMISSTVLPFGRIFWMT